MDGAFKIYKHNPPHLLLNETAYMLTGSCFKKQMILINKEAKRTVIKVFGKLFREYEWEQVAWAVLDNHYHFLVKAKESACLPRLINRAHSAIAKLLNQMDQTPGRRIWYNYWDSCITFEASLYARMNYIHYNPVKHGLVKESEEYDFCSYRYYLEQGADWVQKLWEEYPFDRLKITDDF